ncbi:MAG: AmiS/UreI family transporter [Ornithinimicrobium sp.]
MGSVGLLYVGAVLFLNGMMLLGYMNARSVIPLNIFVGLLQVVTPTFLIFTAAGDSSVILGASGLYLFGFTYLYVAFNQWMGLDGTGLGYFSLFVAICALFYSYVNFVDFDDPAFGVIWLHWALLWSLFFLLLGRGQAGLGRYTGAVAATQGWITGAIPAFLLLTGRWEEANTVMTVLLGLCLVGLAALYPVMTRARREQEVAASV